VNITSTALRRAGLAAGAIAMLAAAPMLVRTVRAQDPYGEKAGRQVKGGPIEDLTNRPVHPPRGEGPVTYLFTGKEGDLAANWVNQGGQPAKWPVAHGAMTSRGGNIMTRERYRDYRLHVEFKVPYMPDKTGQARGNSGVFMQGRYEVQVLDSFGVPHPGKGECGALYNIKAPLTNACKPPLQWQTYDIIYRAPRGDESTGSVSVPGSLTVLQNGIVVQAGTPIDKLTGGAIDKNMLNPGPILLQDHGNAMQYRNIWIVPLPETTPDYYEDPAPRKL